MYQDAITLLRIHLVPVDLFTTYNLEISQKNKN